MHGNKIESIRSKVKKRKVLHFYIDCHFFECLSQIEKESYWQFELCHKTFEMRFNFKAHFFKYFWALYNFFVFVDCFFDILLSAIRKLYLMYMCVIWDLDPISWKKFLACICFYHWLYFLLLFGNVVVRQPASKFFDIFSLGEKTLISGIY